MNRISRQIFNGCRNYVLQAYNTHTDHNGAICGSHHCPFWLESVCHHCFITGLPVLSCPGNQNCSWTRGSYCILPHCQSCLVWWSCKWFKIRFLFKMKGWRDYCFITQQNGAAKWNVKFDIVNGCFYWQWMDIIIYVITIIVLYVETISCVEFLMCWP